MNTQENKLGRGLSALLGDSKAKMPIANKQNISTSKKDNVEMVKVEEIVAGIYQPRKFFDQQELEELSDSIKANGLIQPIIVRKNENDNHYEIIAGERRFRASKLAGLTEIPVIIKKINNHEALEIALIENIQRSDLSFIEEALGYKQLGDEFSYTQEQIAKKTGKSRSHIANILRLLNLPHTVQSMLQENKISMGHARAIINAKDPEILAKKILQDSLTVKETEDLVRDEKVNTIKTTPLLIRTESKIKFINSESLMELENELADLLDSNVKIHYNQFKNKGKITIEFFEVDKIYELIKTLKEKN